MFIRASSKPHEFHPNLHLLTYLLTPWSSVLLEKLTSPQIVKKFYTFYRTRRFVNTFTSAHHLSLPWARPIQSKLPIPLPKFHLNIFLPSTLVSSKQTLSLGFPHQNPIYTSPLPHTGFMPRPSHSSQFDHPKNPSFCMSVRQFGSNSPPMDQFSSNFIHEYFSKICQNIVVSLQYDKNKEYFTWRPFYIYNNILLNSFQNEKCCRQICGENQDTHFILNNFFFL